MQAGPVLKINRVYPEITQPACISEIGYQFPFQAEKPWQMLNFNMRVGATLHGMSLGNPDVLGVGLGGTADLFFHLLETEKVELSLLAGTGIAWVQKPYDRDFNPTNNALGTHFNNLTRISLRAEWNTRPLRPFVSFTYTHLSNAHIRVPNLGLNVPSLGVGVRWKSERPIALVFPKEKFSPSRSFFSLRLGLGGTAVTAPNGPIYPVYVGAIAYNRFAFFHRFRWKVGVESFVSYASYAILKDYDQPVPQTAWNATGIIAFTGMEWLLGRVGLVAHLGPYLKQAFQMEYILYTKLGVKYYLHDQQIRPRWQPFVGVFMHAHSGESDFLEVGMGWNF